MKRRGKRTAGYRSGLEARLVPPLLAQGARYEPLSLRYKAADRWYTPDVILPNAIALEIKGWFKASDRTKMLAVKAAHPCLDIRMVLAAPQQRLSKTSTTTLAAWCDKNGFPWCGEFIPARWLLEPLNERSLCALATGRPRVAA